MSMLLMTGQVLNVLQTPEGTNREGTKYGGYHQVQLLCEEVLQNGEKRNSLFTLTCEEPDKFKKLTGQNVAVLFTWKKEAFQKSLMLVKLSKNGIRGRAVCGVPVASPPSFFSLLDTIELKCPQIR